MRVLYFSRDYTTHDWRYLQKLSEACWEVWFLRLERGPVELEARPLPKGVRPVSWKGGSRSYPGVKALLLLPDLRRVLAEIQPDLLHAGPIPSCGFLAALSGFRPLVLMSWGSDVLRQAQESRLIRWMTRFALTRCSLAVGDSSAVREKIKALGFPEEERIVTFPWGIDLSRFQPGESGLPLRKELGWEGNPVILSTRSWEPHYGIETLLLAFARLVKEQPLVRLILMGEGTLADWVRRFIRENGLLKVVHLTGQVPHDALADFFRFSDLYVSCTSYDGTSISLLEAMACALPVVVSDIPGNREWVKPPINGWLFPPGDSEGLLAAFTQALKERSQWEAIGQRNLHVARERADWDRNFDLLMKGYKRVLAQEAL